MMEFHTQCKGWGSGSWGLGLDPNPAVLLGNSGKALRDGWEARSRGTDILLRS